MSRRDISSNCVCNIKMILVIVLNIDMKISVYLSVVILFMNYVEYIYVLSALSYRYNFVLDIQMLSFAT